MQCCVGWVAERHGQLADVCVCARMPGPANTGGQPEVNTCAKVANNVVKSRKLGVKLSALDAKFHEQFAKFNV